MADAGAPCLAVIVGAKDSEVSSDEKNHVTTSGDL